MATTDTIQVYIGTDKWQRDSGAEDVLEYSIVKNSSRPVQIHWMRSGDPGWEISEIGEGGAWAAGGAIAGGWVKGRGMTWGTPFSCFRFAVPELMGFEGTAIYLDADMLVLGDIAHLEAMLPSGSKGIRCVNAARTDVAVIDCSWFRGKPWWPSIERMKSTQARVFEYMRLLKHWQALDCSLPPTWNDIDGKLYDRNPAAVDLIHYSHVMVGQPWRPYENVVYPDVYPYVKTSKNAALTWFALKAEMEAARAF